MRMFAYMIEKENGYITVSTTMLNETLNPTYCAKVAMNNAFFVQVSHTIGYLAYLYPSVKKI